MKDQGNVYVEKCAIFIDGGYLKSVLKRINNFPLDYLKFSDKISRLISCSRLRTYYYDCLPIRRESEKSNYLFNSRKKFFQKLNFLPRFEVSLGELQFIAGQYKQKKIDVLMSLDIADKCFEEQIAHAVLVAGDSDYIPAIKRAKSYGAIVHLFSYKDSVNKEMIGEVDEFHILDEDFLLDCKLEERSTISS